MTAIEILDIVAQKQYDFPGGPTVPTRVILDRKSFYTLAAEPSNGPLDRDRGTLFGMQLWIANKVLYQGTEQPTLIEVTK